MVNKDNKQIDKYIARQMHLMKRQIDEDINSFHNRYQYKQTHTHTQKKKKNPNKLTKKKKQKTPPDAQKMKQNRIKTYHFPERNAHERTNKQIKQKRKEKKNKQTKKKINQKE